MKVMIALDASKYVCAVPAGNAPGATSTATE